MVGIVLKRHGIKRKTGIKQNSCALLYLLKLVESKQTRSGDGQGKKEMRKQKNKKSHLFEQQIKSRKSVNKEVKTNKLNFSY